MKDRYRVNKQGSPHYVEHRTEDETGWCGPLIMSSDHSRAGELPEDVICICCGDFCEGVDDHTVATVRRFDRKMQKAEEASEERAADLERLRRAGVDVSKLPPPAKPARAKRVVQLDIFKR